VTGRPADVADRVGPVRGQKLRADFAVFKKPDHKGRLVPGD
jgi:hypothetical protein